MTSLSSPYSSANFFRLSIKVVVLGGYKIDAITHIIGFAGRFDPSLLLFSTSVLLSLSRSSTKLCAAAVSSGVITVTVWRQLLPAATLWVIVYVAWTLSSIVWQNDGLATDSAFISLLKVFWNPVGAFRMAHMASVSHIAARPSPWFPKSCCPSMGLSP